MSVPYFPFDRSTRISSVFNGNGATRVFTSTFKIFSPDDVEVWRKLPGESTFTRYTAAAIALTAEAPATFTVTFPGPPVLNTKFYFKGRRLHERSTAIGMANRLDVAALDRELTRLGMIQQEHYREIGQALRADPGITAPALTETILDGRILIGGPGNALVNGPLLSDIGDLTGAAQEAINQARYYAELALGYKNAVALLAETVLDAADLTESVLPTVQHFSGDGVTTDFDLGNPQIDKRSTSVHISGVYQSKDSYSITDGILSFGAPPPEGTSNIEVVTLGSVAISYSIARPPEGTTFIEIVEAFPPIGNFIGRIVYYRPDGLLYAYDGAEWVVQGGGSFELPENATFIELVETLPVSDNFEGRTAYQLSDGTLNTFTDGDWISVASGGGGTVPEGASYIQTVSALPSSGNFEGRTVYLSSDGKFHIYTEGAWAAAGGAGPGTLPDNATFIELVEELPVSGNFEGRIVYHTGEGKLYTFTDGAWQTTTASADINFPDGFTGIQIVGALPVADNYEGRTVYLNTDGKLWRYTDDGWSKAVDAEDLIGQIVSTQISDNAITTPKIVAGAITAGKLAVNSVTADAILAGAILTGKLAAGAVTADKVAASAITADKIAAGAVTAAKVSVTSLSALSATLGAVNIQSAILGSLQVDTINLAGNAVTVQAGADTAGNVTVNASGFTIVQSVAITWGTAAIWLFAQFRCTTAEDVEVDFRNNGVSVLGAPFSVRAAADNMVQIFKLLPSGTISGSGTIGVWIRNAGSGNITIRNRGLGVLAAKR